MAIFAIGDTHLSLGTDKPMDVFGGRWNDYARKLKENWEREVGENDSVIIVGDVSWAMNYDELKADFEFLDALPGKKYIVKGNHDFWFDTMKKNREFTERCGFSTIDFINHSCVVIEDTAVCGTRGWFAPEQQNTPHDQKIFARELSRLRAALTEAKATGKTDIVAAIHYPPLYRTYECPDIMNMLTEYGVSTCVYGHIHSSAVKNSIEGEFFGVEYLLVSADTMDFVPKRIR